MEENERVKADYDEQTRQGNESGNRRVKGIKMERKKRRNSTEGKRGVVGRCEMMGCPSIPPVQRVLVR